MHILINVQACNYANTYSLGYWKHIPSFIRPHCQRSWLALHLSHLHKTTMSHREVIERTLTPLHILYMHNTFGLDVCIVCFLVFKNTHIQAKVPTGSLRWDTSMHVFFWELVSPTACLETNWANQCSSPTQMVLDWIYYYPVISHLAFSSLLMQQQQCSPPKTYLDNLGVNGFVNPIMKTSPLVCSRWFFCRRDANEMRCWCLRYEKSVPV